MNLSRRSALFGGLVAVAAPAVIRTPGLLMPVKAYGESPGMFVLEDMAALQEQMYVRLVDKTVNPLLILEQIPFMDLMRPIPWRVEARAMYFKREIES